MNLRHFHNKIGRNYAWELELFYKFRDFKDGISFFDWSTTWDKYMGDHNPQFNIFLTLFNFKIFDFTVYNIWHIDNKNSPFYEEYLEEEKMEGHTCESDDE